MSDPRIPGPARKWLAWLVAALLWAGGATVGFVSEVQSRRVGACVNHTLAERNPITQREAASNAEFADAVARFLTSPDIADPKARTELTRVAREHAATLRADAAIRAQHPLGTC